MAKKKQTKSKEIICENCNVNKVSKERMDFIGKAICLECADEQSDVLAVQDCDKDGVVELNLVDSKTFYNYSKTKTDE